MRGKLRDKRTEAQRDIFQREVFERKRPTKRGNRSITWLTQELEDNDLLDVDENEEAQVNLPKKQAPKKK
jgi:hypothetical protein